MMSWPSITRDRVIANAKKGFGSGLNRVPYSQEDFSGDYRADCSGFVCRALGLTKADAEAHGVDWWGGMNTVSLVTSGALRKIGINDLKPGDLAGNCGPGTAGDSGHVYVFDEWVNNDPDDSRMWIYEQCGGTRGPIHTIRTWPYPGTCHAYRYAGIDQEDEDDMDQKTFDERLRGADIIPIHTGRDPKNPNFSLPSAIEWSYEGIKQNRALLKALAAQLNPKAFAAELAPLLQAAGPVSQDTIEAAFRTVLGSLDGK